MLIPHSDSDKAIKRVRKVFAASVPATVLVTGVTNGALVPVYYRMVASAAASVRLFAGSGGASLAGFHLGAGTEINGPWWDQSGAGSGVSLEIRVDDDPGNGEVEVWYITRRTG